MDGEGDDVLVLNYYPARLCGLDPLFTAPVKLFICDVLNLDKYPDIAGVYCLLNHPVTNVHIIGDVRTVIIKTKFIRYDIDDGTGCIKCILWRDELDDHAIYKVVQGNLVRVVGTIGNYEERNEITITSISVESDPNVEMVHSLEVIRLHKTVYSKPFNVPLFVKENLLKMNLMDNLIKFLNQASHLNMFKLIDLKTVINENGIFEKINEDGIDIDDKMVDHIIDQVRKEGYILPAGRELFTYISDAAMECHIMNIFQENPDSQLSIEMVYERVKYVDVMRFLPFERVKNTVFHLVDESQLYPVDDTKYSLVQ